MAEGTRPVRLRVVSDMTSPEGERTTDKRAHRGTLAETAEGVTLTYDEGRDGERARIALSAEPGRAQMRRTGMTSAVLTFVPGERHAGRYVTMYGEIPVAVETRRVALTRAGTGGELTLEYDVYVAGERTAATVLCATWRF